MKSPSSSPRSSGPSVTGPGPSSGRRTAIPLANVTTSQLEYFVAALSASSWKDAAATVGVTASALSQGLGELERRLGVVLFDKQGRRRVPTADARDALPHVSAVLAELRELTRWAQEARDGGSGQLSIGMIDTAAIHHFGDTLAAFRNEYPDLTVRLLVQPSNVLIDRLRAGEVDAVVCVDPDEDDRFVLEPLIAEPLHVYAPPGVEHEDPAQWGPWVSFPAGSRSRSLMARELRRRGIGFNVVAESSQPAVLKEMVRLGMGWAILSAVDAEATPHQLQRVTTDALTDRTLTLIRRADRVPNAALTNLLDRLRAAASTSAR